MSKLMFLVSAATRQALLVQADSRDEAVELYQNEFALSPTTPVCLWAVPRPSDRAGVLRDEVPDVSPGVYDNERAGRVTRAANSGTYNPLRPPR